MTNESGNKNIILSIDEGTLLASAIRYVLKDIHDRDVLYILSCTSAVSPPGKSYNNFGKIKRLNWEVPLIKLGPVFTARRERLKH